MAVRGWALVQFNWEPATRFKREEPATRFKKLQGVGFKSRRGWRIVSLHGVRRIYSKRAQVYPEFHAFVELIANSEPQLKKAFLFLERFTHVEGYME